ncbi:MAG: hypothetical protein A2888_03535 [Chlamydiae bacterium RIFCSPLOWO2_01_FULL_28_7]|nr:MAG: hypothetical protein A2888_03535 [Chlamydiae bacterium RIFCSPLOWO2_01_FULL_28_7]
MHFGTVKWFSPDEHFGFLIEDGVEKEEIFFHQTNILTLDTILENGDRVSFEVEYKNKKLQAIKIQPLEE